MGHLAKGLHRWLMRVILWQKVLLSRCVQNELQIYVII
jgi:hypothetical protein